MAKRFLLFLLIILSSCESIDYIRIKTTPEVTFRINESNKESIQQTGLLDIQQELVNSANKLVGAHTLNPRGEHFALDCSGLTLAVYYENGIDLRQVYPKYTGNGVTRLYKALEDANLLSQTPALGDLIFWDDTWDANEDGLWNDPLTHVGMVVAIHDNGNIDYIHTHVNKGITIETMNLQLPDSREHNAGMRMRYAGKPYPPARWLASHLFKSFGKAYLLEMN